MCEDRQAPGRADPCVTEVPTVSPTLAVGHLLLLVAPTARGSTVWTWKVKPSSGPDSTTPSFPGTDPPQARPAAVPGGPRTQRNGARKILWGAANQTIRVTCMDGASDTVGCWRVDTAVLERQMD